MLQRNEKVPTLLGSRERLGGSVADHRLEGPVAKADRRESPVTKGDRREDLPQAAVQREVVVHQVDQEVVVVDVLDDHARGRLVLVQLGPLLDPQGEGLVLGHREGGLTLSYHSSTTFS